jgi:hypothetical protein
LPFPRFFQTVSFAISRDLQEQTKHYGNYQHPLEIPSIEQCEKNCGEQYLAPILGMASCPSSLGLQVEAASALQAVAESDAVVVAKTCGAEAAAQLQRLLVSDDIRVVYPTVCALSSLSLCPQAVKDIFLARESTLEECQDARKVVDYTTAQQTASRALLGALPLAPLVVLVAAMLLDDATSKIVKIHLDLTLRRASKGWASPPKFAFERPGAANDNYPLWCS